MAKKKGAAKRCIRLVVDVWFGRGLRFRKGSISRTIDILSDQTLDDLHWAIYYAFDRYDDHLYRFYFGTTKPYDRNAYHIDGYNPFADTAETEEVANEVLMGDLDLPPKATFFYLFDFGDDWWHRITVLDPDAPYDPNKSYPDVVKKKGDSPPQYEMWEEESEDEDD